MNELGRVTFSPDITSGGGSPRASLRGSLSEKENGRRVQEGRKKYDDRQDKSEKK